MRTVAVTASANTGFGLWTMICFGFSQIFGCQSKSFKRKQEKVLDIANKDLESQLNELDPNHTITDYRVVWYGLLSATVSVIAVLPDVEEEKKAAKKEEKKEKVVEELSIERIVEILRNCLNKLYSNGEESVGQIVISLRSYKNNILNAVADKIDKDKTFSNAADVLKRSIKELI